MKGKVYLVGAGPGANDLISLRALNILGKCDTVVYDRLASEDFYKDLNCEKIDVGKKVGHHSVKQNEINEIIVQKALEGKTVVRLKGGDPFIFGRGGEEVIALQEHNIPYEVIPGITSAISVPELAGIPPTHRKISQDLHIVTGHTAEEENVNYKALAQEKGTLVFLMGVGNIEKIANRLMEFGKDENTPVAFIENGSTPKERITKTILKNAYTTVVEENVKPPAIIVMGEVVSLDFRGTIHNKSVAVTGTNSFRNRLKTALEKKCYVTNEVCKLDVSAYENSTIKNVLANISAYEWVVLTSRNGVEIFMENMKKYSIDMRSLYNLKFAVIGKGTYDRLADYGIYADYTPEKYTAEELGKGLSTIAKGRILILRAEKGSSELTNNLIDYDDVPIYDIKCSYCTQATEDYIVFGSSSGVESYTSSNAIEDKTKIIAIGNITANKLKEKGYCNIYIAKEYSVNGILKELEIIENAENEKIKSK